jgi:hypothetical protein
VSLALCVWELADHACRWGALAAPDGRVRLSWRSDGRFISLSWIETDVGRQASIRDLRRRLISERLPWRLEPAAGLIHWSVRFESREPALPAYAPIPRTARAA